MAVPSNEEIRRPLLESLADGQEHKLADTVADVARRMQLSAADLAELIPSGRHRLFYDHLCWTRWYLVKGELLEITRRGYTRITDRGVAAIKDAPALISDEWMEQNPEYAAYKKAVAQGTTVPPIELTDSGQDEAAASPTDPHVWIEKTIVVNRPDRITGENAIGKVLWSPQRSEKARTSIGSCARSRWAMSSCILRIILDLAVFHRQHQRSRNSAASRTPNGARDCPIGWS
jgi:hypothetical protein